MAARGRKSKAALSVVGVKQQTTVSRDERPEPPRDLTREQAAEWRKIVERYPAEHFKAESHPMLASLCRHIVMQRRVAEMIAAIEEAAAEDDSGDFDWDIWDRLGKAQERETRAILSAGVRLGFAYSTSYERKKPRERGAKPPWDFGKNV